nr:immunoglobulin light chain junction region [Macaca mulatta]
CLQYNSVSFTF